MRDLGFMLWEQNGNIHGDRNGTKEESYFEDQQDGSKVKKNLLPPILKT